MGIQGIILQVVVVGIFGDSSRRLLFTASLSFQNARKTVRHPLSRSLTAEENKVSNCVSWEPWALSSSLPSVHKSPICTEKKFQSRHWPLQMKLTDRRGELAESCGHVLPILFLTSGLSSSITHDALAVGTGKIIDETVAIIGGNGRTGMAVAETLAKAGVRAITMTRSGKDPYAVVKLPETVKSYLSHYNGQVDVRDLEALTKAIADTKATTIVFAASASRMGGNSFDVDERGVANAANAAKRNKCKLIVISALAVDRPDSQSFKMTNSLGSYVDKIMDAKLLGEQEAKNILNEGNGTKPGDYVIIRPGVLLSGKSRNGASDIELNQGDMIGGGISRDELAGVVLGAIQSNARGITVEAYRKGTRTKLQPEFDTTSGYELVSDSYAGLFEKATVGT